MSAKILWPCSLVLAVLGASVAPAQPPTSPLYGQPGARAATAPEFAEANSAPAAPAPGELSSWIRYGRPDCCDPVGGDGPIATELLVRFGPSLPVAGGAVNNTIELGWMVHGAGRSLFYDASRTAAWTVELGLGYIYNNGNRPNLIFPLNPVPPASGTGPNDPRSGSVRSLHRTFGSLALGREWYLNAAADDFGHYWALWRFGLDVGVHLGTSNMHFTEDRDPPENFQRTHDVFYGTSFALHSDVEIPCGGCCLFHTGFRAEWRFDWLDVFPHDRRGNLHSVNLLWGAGVRF